MNTVIVGAPGRYSTRQANANTVRALARWTACAVLVVGALASGWGAWLRHPAAGWQVLAAVALVAAGGAVLAHQQAAGFFAAAGRQRRGTAAERQTVRGLEAVHASLVVNGADVRAGGDADHVVVVPRSPGRAVVAVVETKAGGGNVHLRAGHLITGSGRTIPGNPLAQAQRQAAGLARLLRCPVAAIVCIPGMQSPAFAAGSVLVCGTRSLQQAVDSVPPAAVPDNFVDVVIAAVPLKA